MLLKKEGLKKDLQNCDFRELSGFEYLYNRYWESVFAVCYNNTRKVELSRGMTQDIFRSIWERRFTIEIADSIEKYLIRSAKYKVAEYYRNQAIRSKHLSSIQYDFTESINQTQEDFDQKILEEKIQLLVSQLPSRCREVFELSRFHGFSNKEISNQLQISLRAVEYHISRALKYLRKNLKVSYNV